MSNCQCERPPGGSLTCEPHQLAVCIVEDGEAVMYCKDPPSGATGDALNRWILRVVTGRQMSWWEPLTSNDRSILTQGRFEDPATGRVVYFGVPEDGGENEDQLVPMGQTTV